MELIEVETLLSTLVNGTNLDQSLTTNALDKLSLLFQSDYAPVEIQAYAGLVLNPHTGLFGYLSRIRHDNEGASGDVTRIFELIGYLITNYSSAVDSQANGIVVWCLGNLNLNSSLSSRSTNLMEMLLRDCPCQHVDKDEIIVALKIYIASNRKISPTLRCALFSLIGTIANVHPTSAEAHIDWIFKVILDGFNIFDKLKNVSLVLVEGCFLSLNGVLNSFELPESTKANIHNRLKIFCELSGQKHTTNRAALTVFIEHGNQIAKFIYEDISYWEKCLSHWISPGHSTEHQQMGSSAFNTFYKVVSQVLVSNDCPADGKEKFELLSRPLEEVLSNSQRDKHRLQRAVLALAELTEAYKKFSSELNLKKVANSLIALVEESLLHDDGLYKNAYRCLSLQSVAKILSVVNTVADLNFLSRLAVSLIEDFPSVPQNFVKYNLSAFENCIFSLSSIGVVKFNDFLEQVIYQGLLRTCSHALYVDAQLLEEKDCLSYKSFLPLWIHLLTISRRSSSQIFGAVGGYVYDAFLKMFLQIISKLDLSLTTGLEDKSDPSIALEASSPNDFHIFVNLVDLFESIILVSDQNHMKKWLHVVLEDCINRSRASPLISGFYKVISVMFQVGSSLGLFEESFDFKLVLMPFLKETTERVGRIKGELEIACLQMILLTPTLAIEAILNNLTSVILSAVRVGRGYPILLSQCIDALDRWLQHLPAETLEPVLVTVLPEFDILLQSALRTSSSLSPINASKSKIILKSGGKYKKRILGPSDSLLLSFQKKFLIFLGKLNPNLTNSLLRLPESNAILEGSDLVYNLPLTDMKAKINLNPLLPRLIELSLSCGDRSTRVAACELLHGVVLLAIARTKDPDSNPHIFRKLLTACLSLSCDTDKVVSDLFNPLVLQITHYYSGKVQFKSKETSILIEVLMAAVTHPFESGLRDFAARCLNEFLSWCVRQSTEDVRMADVNIRAVIRNISCFSVHPDRGKRLGGAVAFNHVYSVLREQENVLSVYWLQLYDCFFKSLGMCSADDDARVVSRALTHLRRPLLERADTFMQIDPNRRVPPDLGEGLLKDVVIYTFNGCSSYNKFLRKVAQTSIEQLVRAYPNCSTIKEFLTINKVVITVQNIEGSVEDKQWEEQVVGLMGYVNWMLSVGMFQLTDIVPNSCLLEAAAIFIKNIQAKSIISNKDVVCLVRFLNEAILLLDADIFHNLAKLTFNPKLPVGDKELSDVLVTFLKEIPRNSNYGNHFIKALPCTDQEYMIDKIKGTSTVEQTAYLQGVHILIASNLLQFDCSGIDLLKAVESKLNAKRGRKLFCTFLSPTTKTCLKNLVPFFLKKDVTLPALLELITDESEIDNDGLLMKRGEYFFKMFEDSFCKFIFNSVSAVEVLLSYEKKGVELLIDILNHVEGCTDIPRTVKRDFATHIVLWWETRIQSLSVERSTLLLLLKTVIKCVPETCGYLQNTPSGSWLLSVMQQKNDLSIEEIVTFFQLLPLFSSRLEKENPELDETLKTFRRFHREYFQLFKPVEQCNVPIVLAMERGLASSIEATGSLVTLKFTTENLLTKKELFRKAKLSFARMFPDDHVVEGLRLLLNSAFSESLPEEVKWTALEWITSTLRSASDGIVRKFFVHSLPLFLTSLQKEYSFGMSAELLVFNKIAAVRTLEVLYLRTSKEERMELEKEVVATNNDCKGLFHIFIKICSREIGVRSKPSPHVASLLRILNCDCVNLLCSIVSQFREEKPYNLFLFSNFLHRNTVEPDEVKKYKIGLDFATLPSRKKISTAIKMDTTQQTATEPSLAYAHSQTLFDSTLSEDVRKFDLSDVGVEKEIFSQTAPALEVELELDDLNQHEIMASVCGTIHHMKRCGVHVGDNLPGWVDYLIEILQDTLSRNQKLIALKIIHNVDSAAASYAEDLAPPILQCAITIFDEPNYFLCDLLAMILEWKPKLETAGENLLKIIEMFVYSSIGKRKDIVKNMMTFVKNITEVWKESLNKQALTKLLFHRINTENEATQYSLLSFASILLRNDLFQRDLMLIDQLSTWLLKTVEKDAKNLDLASEVLGSALSALPELSEKVGGTLRSLGIVVIYGIHKFYPEISSLVVRDLLNESWHGPNEIKRRCLEMMVSHFKRNRYIFEETIMKPFVIDMLKSSVLVVLEGALELLRELIEMCKTDTMLAWLPFVVKLSDHSSKKIRALSCDILMSSENWASDDTELYSSVKYALLKRLNDDDEEIERKSLEFWCNREQASTSSERLLWLLKDLYSPDVESEYTEYACKVILHGSIKTTDYNLDIFDHPLEKCTFTEYQVLVSHRARYSTLAPMFAPSVANELSLISMERPLNDSLHLRLRATAQSLLFTPTVSTSEGPSPEPQTIMDGEFKRPTTSFRFLRSNASVSNVFAKRAVEKKAREEAQELERYKEKDGSVKLTRTYRKGDFPDIQIKHCNFIRTLIALARKDPQVAKEMFACLFNGVVNDPNQSIEETFWKEAAIALNNILENSYFSDSIFLAVLFQISLGSELLLSSELVCQAAKATGLFSLGILIIEQTIRNATDEAPPSKRIRGLDDDDKSKEWLFLAQLFQALGDSDALRGVLLDKVAVDGNAARAIQLETALDWSAAIEAYTQVFEEELEPKNRMDFYDEAYFNCLEQLSNWSGIADSVYQTVNRDVDFLLSDSWSRDILLPKYIRSKMMVSLESDATDFQQWVTSPRKPILDSKYPAEVAVAHWLNGNNSEALLFLNESYKRFLKEWSHTNEWDLKQKMNSLRNLQIITELQCVLSLETASLQDSTLIGTLKQWKTMNPDKNQKLVNWDIRLAIRGRLTSLLPKLNCFSEDIVEETQKELLHGRLSMVKAAIGQDNSRLAGKYLKLAGTHATDVKENCLWKYYRNLKKMLDVKKSSKSLNRKLCDIADIWTVIESTQENLMETEDYNLLSAHINVSLLSAVTTIIDLSENSNVNVETLENFPKSKTSLERHWLEYANKSIECFGEFSEWREQKGQVYVQLAKFHRKYSSDWKMVLESLLKGMATGASEARSLFGCLLAMNDTSATWDLSHLVSDVPSWMFLMWRHQLMACLSVPNLSANQTNLIKLILNRLADDYPNALSHCLRVSRDNVKAEHNYQIQNMSSKVFTNQLEQLFVDGISRLACPLLKLKYFLQKALSKPSITGVDLIQVKENVIHVDNGDAYKVLEKFLEKMDALAQSKEDIKAKIKELVIEINKVTPKLSTKLKSYSKSLSTFQGLNVEIPGQYDQDIEPKVFSHVKIVSFSPDIIPIPSQRRPFKLTVIGDDAKEYQFLVKFGEDLRQDERIQQVFRLIGKTLRQSKLSTELSVDGYSVIPLSTSHGLIQWLENTKSLSSLITKEIDPIAVKKVHYDFISCGSTGTLIERHLLAYEKITDLEMMNHFERLLTKLPSYCLRNSFLSLSSSPEQFLSLRGNFAHSLGVMNVAHWILGVGDRHLDNLLLNTKSGRVVGIDFGLSFGFATQAIPIPELVPFRLTPQMVNVLNPLNESGWLKLTMVHTLKTLREDPSLLLAVLEVFILEPCIDWEAQAHKLVLDKSDDDKRLEWSARQKVGEVEGKLLGLNPIVSFQRDLTAGHSGKTAFPYIVKVLAGSKERNVRARVGTDGLTSEDQVACLLDLATDPVVLGFTYIGWSAFL